MPSPNPTEVQNQLFGHTGLPHLIIALLILLVVWIAESMITTIGEEAEIISINAESRDDFEFDTSQTEARTHLNDIADSLTEQITNSSLIIDQLPSHPKILQLGEADRQQVYAHLARALLHAKDYKGAIQILGDFSTRERLAMDLQFNYAFGLSKSGDTEAAIDAYQLLLESQPNHQSAALNMGLLLKRTGQCETAQSVLSVAIDISSGLKRAKAYAARAGCNAERKDYTQAVSDYEKSIEYRPDHALTWRLYARTRAHTAIPYHEKANTYDKALALAPKHYKFLLEKAQFHLDHYAFPSAIKTLKDATSLSGNNLDARRLLVWAYLESGKRNSARKQLRYLKTHETAKHKQQLIEYLAFYNNKKFSDLKTILKRGKSKRAEIDYLSALVNIKTRYYNRALRHLEKLTGHPEYAGRALLQMARIHRLRKDYETAMPLYLQAVERNSSASFIWYEIARLQAKQEQYSQALDSLERALAITPGERRYLLAKASYLKQLNRPRDAIAVINRLLTDHPVYIRAYRLLAELHVSANDSSEAKNIFQEILKIKPDDQKTLYHLALIHLQDQEYQEAQSMLKRLLEEQTDNTDARFLLASSYCQTNQIAACKTELNRVLKLDKDHAEALELQQTRISGVENNSTIK